MKVRRMERCSVCSGLQEAYHRTTSCNGSDKCQSTFWGPASAASFTQPYTRGYKAFRSFLQPWICAGLQSIQALSTALFLRVQSFQTVPKQFKESFNSEFDVDIVHVSLQAFSLSCFPSSQSESAVARHVPTI